MRTCSPVGMTVLILVQDLSLLVFFNTELLVLDKELSFSALRLGSDRAVQSLLKYLYVVVEELKLCSGCYTNTFCD